MIEEWFFGFHPPRLSPRGWFGHVEAWGYTVDDTWLFLDPQLGGTRIVVTHHHDDVLDQLTVRNELCNLILKYPALKPNFSIPLHGPMTCAAICGHLVGIRALAPYDLKRSLLRKGAEVIHGNAEGRSGRESRA